MGKGKFAGSVLLISIMILSVFGSAVSIEVEAKPIAKGPTNGLEPHEPIYIDGNDNFTAENGVSSGSGTESDPYIIEGWDINPYTANGIEIRNTDVYFIIRNCVIHIEKSVFNDGIYFHSVQNGKIDNITSYNASDGILLRDSSNNNITSCILCNNSWNGIYLYCSSNNNIMCCNVYNNSEGIRLYWASNNNITLCTVRDSFYEGIEETHSQNSDIHYCNIYGNPRYGVFDGYSGDIVNATYCWWGSVSGPYNPNTNPSGTGDSVTDNVIYEPWLTEPVEGADWTPLEGEEEGVPKKEGKPEEGFNMVYLLGIGVAVVAGIIVGVLLLRRRKITVPQPEIPAPKPELIAPQIPTFTLRCPQCKSTFNTEKKEKPFKVKCLSCRAEGVIK